MICLFVASFNSPLIEEAIEALPTAIEVPLSDPQSPSQQILSQENFYLKKQEVELAKPETPFVPSVIQVGMETDLKNMPLEEEILSLKNAEETLTSNEEIAVHQEKSRDAPKSPRRVRVNMREVFSGAPLIYSLLLLLSLGTFTLWIYHLTLTSSQKLLPKNFSQTVENLLAQGNWREALSLCEKENCLLSVLIRAAISAKSDGSQAMIARMQMEGKKSTNFFWQRLSLLNDVALIAPMIGLLGTVLGMFYAFYDVNRSVDSIYALFDGLGISVGTTVAGLILAIVALFFHSTLRYRLIRQLGMVETKAQQIALHPSVHAMNAHSGETHEFNT